jgi:hypothetical protein
MTQLADSIDLGPREEAGRLWEGALAAYETASTDIVALCETLDLGLHAAEILAVQLLRPVKDDFPATIGAQLSTPVPEVDVWRDAISVPKTLQFTDIVDLLSAEDLECVSPGLHRGWEDRRFACRRSRATARGATGLSLTADEQEQLLLLSAYRNRLFRCPPPVRVVPGDVLAAFPALRRLVDGLTEAAG